MAGELVIPVAPAGAGKTTWVSARFPASRIVSLDAFRLACTDDAGDQTATPAALALRDIVLGERLRRGLTTVADATSTRRGYRLPLISAAALHGRPTVAVLFHTPLAECIRRQTVRDRKVPEEVIARMFADVAASWRDLAREVDCVVHVAPEHGQATYRVGDLPGEVSPCWLAMLPSVPSADQLPWESPYRESLRDC